MGIPHIDELPDRLSHAAPWWIALGVTGVAITLTSGSGPLLSSVALIGIGSDADISRRLREAIASDVNNASSDSQAAAVAGFVRRVHVGMYLLLLAFAWASLLHLSGQSVNAGEARWWLAGDLAASAVLGLGYARLSRRM
ncbi:hypothetical protein [Botrimarina colliarenosi]|nr:hypothetical protein [Botrimarina colliarenosi]